MTESNFKLQYHMGSHKGPYPPLYCRTCGRFMNPITEHARFNENTGQEEFNLLVRCPVPWWRSLLSDHDIAERDKNGDWEWV